MRKALILLTLLCVGCSAAPTAPLECTTARATSVDTLGWVVRAAGDTAGPILAWTCDPRIAFTPRTP